MEQFDKYEPFYHPVYGWQWHEIKPTDEQEIHARSERERIRRKSNKLKKVSKKSRITKNQG